MNVGGLSKGEFVHILEDGLANQIAPKAWVNAA